MCVCVYIITYILNIYIFFSHRELIQNFTVCSQGAGLSVREEIHIKTSGPM